MCLSLLVSLIVLVSLFLLAFLLLVETACLTRPSSLRWHGSLGGCTRG